MMLGEPEINNFPFIGGVGRFSNSAFEWGLRDECFQATVRGFGEARGSEEAEEVEFAGDFFPLAFLLGAIVAAISSYSYVRYSSVNPSSGGIAMLLKDAYGPGVAAGSFSLFMYVSMVVAESLLARTFGTYLLRPFGLQDSAILVPILGVTAIVTAAIVNFIGNTLVERSATITAVAKILGIAVLAIAGLIGVAAVGDGFRSQSSGDSVNVVGLLAGTTMPKA